MAAQADDRGTHRARASTLVPLMQFFCDAGCKVVFEQHKCRVIYEGRVVLVGTHSPTTGLWHLPINPVKSDEAPAMDLQLLPNQRIPQRGERAANHHISTVRGGGHFVNFGTS